MTNTTNNTETQAEVNPQGMTKLYQDFYREALEKYGEKIIILMQVGKFYELYDIMDISTNSTVTNIREAAALLEISVRETVISTTQMRLFAGVPEQVIKKYERNIIRHGYRGVIISQTKEGKLYKRELDHIVSVGTYMDNDSEDEIQTQDRWLWSFFCEEANNEIYLHSSAIHCSTGQIILGDISKSKDIDSLQNDELYLALSTYEPSEILLWVTDEASEMGVTGNILLEAFHLNGNIPITTRKINEKQKKTVKQEEDLLVRCFSMDRGQLFANLGLDRKPEMRRCLAFLLSFVEEHNPLLIRNLKLPTEFQASEHVRLGNHTLEQLGMINKNREKQNECYFHYFNKCITACGRRSLRSRLLQPIQNVNTLRQRIETIQQWRDVVKNKNQLATRLSLCLHKIYDIEKLFRRFQLKTATFQDVYKMLSSLEAIGEVIRLVRDFSIRIDGDSVLQMISELQSIWSIEKIIEMREKASGGLEIEANGFGVGIHPWSKCTSESQNSFEGKWKSYRESFDILANKYRETVSEVFQEPIETDESPFAFKGTKTRCDKIIKANKVNDASLYCEDVRGTYYLRGKDIDMLNQQAYKSRKEWKISYGLFWDNMMTQLMEKFSPIMIECVHMIAEVDVNLVIAMKAEEFGYCNPTFIENEKSGFSATKLRHGILEQIRKDIAYVPHSVSFGSLADSTTSLCSSENGVLLFGVNSSGKSSLMKAIGLSVLLAQCGCPVPATDFHISPYGSLFTRILGNDNMWAGMSSFVVEMTEFRNILEYANEKSLVLGDELCSGTETASAASLVAAGLEYLLKKNATFFFATHLHELQEFNEIMNLPNLKWLHLRVRFDEISGSLIYERDLQEGAGSMMYGLEVCRFLRLPDEFLARATSFRRRLQGVSEDGALGASSSRYNSSVVKRFCEVCRNEGKGKGLEVHHIIPQKDADVNGNIGNGRHKNDMSNLVVLCDDCHTAHHKGELDIFGWNDSGNGKILNFMKKTINDPQTLKPLKQEPKKVLKR